MGQVNYYKMGQLLLQSGVGILIGVTLLQSGSRYYTVGHLLQKMPVHLQDTGTNGDPCLLKG